MTLRRKKGRIKESTDRHLSGAIRERRGREEEPKPAGLEGLRLDAKIGEKNNSVSRNKERKEGGNEEGISIFASRQRRRKKREGGKIKINDRCEKRKGPAGQRFLKGGDGA